MKLRLNLNMTNELQILRNHIKEHGLKGTSQREEILVHLLGAKDHLSPEEIYEAIRRKDPKIGRATVFRTLKLLEDCRLISKVTFADGRHKYEAVRGRPHHDHMICTDCGQAIEFSNPTLESLQDRIAKEHKFTLLWHRHELFGRCRDCSGREKRKKP